MVTTSIAVSQGNVCTPGVTSVTQPTGRGAGIGTPITMLPSFEPASLDESPSRSMSLASCKGPPSWSVFVPPTPLAPAEPNAPPPPAVNVPAEPNAPPEPSLPPEPLKPPALIERPPDEKRAPPLPFDDCRTDVSQAAQASAATNASQGDADRQPEFVMGAGYSLGQRFDQSPGRLLFVDLAELAHYGTRNFPGRHFQAQPS